MSNNVTSRDQRALVGLARAMRREFAKRIARLVEMSPSEARDTILAAQDLLWLTHHALSFDCQTEKEDANPWGGPTP